MSAVCFPTICFKFGARPPEADEKIREEFIFDICALFEIKDLAIHARM